MTYRNDMEALAARKLRLEAEVKAKTKELDTTARLLDEMKAKAKLPVLPNIRVASPCTADWSKMTPVDTERVRHCGDCNKNVYNLSQMTRDEAEALILANEGRLCVRYFQRKDGTILLKDCTVGVANGRKRRLIAAGAATLLAAGGSAAAAFMLRTSDKPKATEYEAIQGGISPTDFTSPDDVQPLQGQATLEPDMHVKMGGMAPHAAFAKPHVKKPAK